MCNVYVIFKENENDAINQYLNVIDPKQSNIEDAVRNESSQVASEKIKVEANDAERRFKNQFRHNTWMFKEIPLKRVNSLNAHRRSRPIPY